MVRNFINDAFIDFFVAENICFGEQQNKTCMRVHHQKLTQKTYKTKQLIIDIQENKFCYIFMFTFYSIILQFHLNLSQYMMLVNATLKLILIWFIILFMRK